MESTQETHIELFRYLRTIVDTTKPTSDPYPQFALVEAYWHLGRIIVETEQSGVERADYGIHLIEQLSYRLSEAFGKGYSLPNMWRFKQFYLAFPIISTDGREYTNLRQFLRTELCWSHYRLLMQLDNLQEREFYINQAADERWPVRFMQKLIRARYYYQTALGQDQFLATQKKIGGMPSPILSQEKKSENLRTRVARVKKVLLERYVGYAFVAQRQFINLGGQDDWIELVFFHIELQRFVLVQFSEHEPASLTAFAQLLDNYLTKQLPTISKPPIGLVIDSQGRVKLSTVSFGDDLTVSEIAMLPQTI